jgi:hypothetical protein
MKQRLKRRDTIRPDTLEAQSKRFWTRRAKLGCDEDPKAFEHTFSKIVPPKKPTPPKPEKKKPR